MDVDTYDGSGRDDGSITDRFDKKCELQAQDSNEDNEDQCPLFMTGLPTDFAKNKGLAAIASLLSEEIVVEGEEDLCKKSPKKSPKAAKEKVKPQPHKGKKGGGKVARSRNMNKASPYAVEKKEKVQNVNRASIGEAQLFLRMWKI
mmetsp:Transcript_11033/g.16687  ORF Transcript_11033/g.16687 Transcript_11033/m.16687 type:complete len:146 (+) Transcript_11033:367-804(+)